MSRGEPVGIALATAVYEPVVPRTAEVVDDEPVVADGDVPADQRLRTRFAKAFRRDHEIVDRHHPCGRASIQSAEVTVAGEDNRPCVHQSVIRPDPGSPAVFDADDRGILEDPRARGRCRIRETEREVERMEMARTPVDQAAAIDVRPDQLRGRDPVEYLDAVVGVVPLEPFRRNPEPVGGCGGFSEPRNARSVVAVDSVLPYEPRDGRLRFFRDLPERARVVLPDQSLEPALGNALAAADLTAVAPRCAPADPVRFEHGHVVAALGEVKCCREAGVTRTDDADIRSGVARESVAAGVGRSRCGIPAVRIGSRAVIQPQKAR